MMFLFLQKVAFFEFVHGKYSEVGGGNLKMQKYGKLVVCVCLMQNFKKQTTVM